MIQGPSTSDDLSLSSSSSSSSVTNSLWVNEGGVQVDAAGTMSSTAPANAAAASLSSSSTSSSSTTTTSHQGLCDYADALDELERELGSSGTTTFIMRHETKLNQQNHHRHHQPHNLLLGNHTTCCWEMNCRKRNIILSNARFIERSIINIIRNNNLNCNLYTT